MEKRLDGNYTRILRAILNKSWRQHPTKQQLYDHLPAITKTIKVRRTRHAGHCWKSKDELKSDILLWTLSHGRAKAGRSARTYIQQFCTDTGYSLEDIPGAMNDRDGRRERVREIRGVGATWWWWLMLNWIVWNRTVFDIETVLTFNWIVWIRTVWINWIAWNRNVFDKLCTYI